MNVWLLWNSFEDYYGIDACFALKGGFIIAPRILDLLSARPSLSRRFLNFAEGP